MRTSILFPILSFFLLFSYCKREPINTTPPLFELLPPESTGITFENTLYETNDLNIITFEYFYNGAGVGILDVNKDGLQDIFFTANMKPSELYLNKGHFTFENITTTAGIDTKNQWATGVSIVDINNDGWSDIYVCMAGPYGSAARKNQFYINNGDGTFSEKAAALGLDDDGHTTQAAFFDYDRDGDLDVYLLTNITEDKGPNVIRPKKLDGSSINTDRLYRNDNGQFVNVSKTAGILKEGYGLGVSITDINEDGWPDIYVSNDYLSNDLLYINNQDGTFSDQAGNFFQHTSYSAMGNDIADFNNDTYMDIVTVDMLPPDNLRRKVMFGSINYNRYRSEIKSGYDPQFMRNTLQLNNGIQKDHQPVFSEIAWMSGIASTDWSWSALFGDLDNDGWQDLLITNGYPRDITNMDFASYKANTLAKGRYTNQAQQELVAMINQIDGAYLPNYIFQNKQDLTFEDKSKKWGFNAPSYSTGAALADLDNDGDLDYVVNNTFAPAHIYQNHSIEQTNHHFLRIKLVGPSQNPGGLGTKVYCYTNGETQFRNMQTVRGFQSSVEPHLHFGLGSNTKVDSIKIIWPDQNTQVVYQINGDQTLEVYYQRVITPNHSEVNKFDFQPIFKKLDQNLGVDFQHEETYFGDFDINPLLPHKFSQMGPCLAVGDVNGDQLEDFFVGGAYNQSGNIYFQQKNGTFRGVPITTGQKYEEDIDAIFFDADQDQDLDLYIVSGGSEFKAGSKYYQDRLYLNDGKGNFNLANNRLPQIHESGSTVVAGDFDGDGDQDLFVGGQAKPHQYPLPAKSYLLVNENGRFTEQTEKLASELIHLGIVNDAIWVDYDQDDQLDLLVTGEWMAIEVFKNVQGKLERQTQKLQLNESVGWWNTLLAKDMDGDGDLDLIAGNLGLNSSLKTAKGSPLQLYLADFDQNGQSEAIISHYLQGQQYPYHFRSDFLSRLQSLQKQIPDYTTYGKSALKDIFPDKVLTKSTIYTAHTFESSWFENIDNQRFERHPLPMEAQMGPIYSILSADFNKDGIQDLLIAGNDFTTETFTGKYDASIGLLLAGQNNKQFQPISSQHSGFYLPGATKDMALILWKKKEWLLLAAQNNTTLELFQCKEHLE